MRLALLALLLSGFAAESGAQIGGTAAPFARMGFSARGVGLGNAGAAVIAAGEVSKQRNRKIKRKKE
jgi:hypothetical protein